MDGWTLPNVVTQFFIVWPLTYDLDLQSQASQGQHRPSCQKSRSNGSNRRASTAKRMVTNTDATKRIISPATWSITIVIWLIVSWFVICRPLSHQWCVSEWRIYVWQWEVYSSAVALQWQWRVYRRVGWTSLSVLWVARFICSILCCYGSKFSLTVAFEQKTYVLI